jgi:hypothetical protein
MSQDRIAATSEQAGSGTPSQASSGSTRTEGRTSPLRSAMPPWIPKAIALLMLAG